MGGKVWEERCEGKVQREEVWEGRYGREEVWEGGDIKPFTLL